jgi:hypothetical protein
VDVVNCFLCPDSRGFSGGLEERIVCGLADAGGPSDGPG